MEFQRYDSFLNRQAQRYIDQKLPACPFCGDAPQWTIAEEKSMFSTKYYFRCEVCGAIIMLETSTIPPLTPEFTICGVGKSNYNNLTINGVFELPKLIKSADYLANIPAGDDIIPLDISVKYEAKINKYETLLSHNSANHNPLKEDEEEPCLNCDDIEQKRIEKELILTLDTDNPFDEKIDESANFYDVALKQKLKQQSAEKLELSPLPDPPNNDSSAPNKKKSSHKYNDNRSLTPFALLLCIPVLLIIFFAYSCNYLGSCNKAIGSSAKAEDIVQQGGFDSKEIADGYKISFAFKNTNSNFASKVTLSFQALTFTTSYNFTMVATNWQPGETKYFTYTLSLPQNEMLHNVILKEIALEN